MFLFAMRMRIIARRRGLTCGPLSRSSLFYHYEFLSSSPRQGVRLETPEHDTTPPILNAQRLRRAEICLAFQLEGLLLWFWLIGWAELTRSFVASTVDNYLCRLCCRDRKCSRTCPLLFFSIGNSEMKLGLFLSELSVLIITGLTNVLPHEKIIYAAVR